MPASWRAACTPSGGIFDIDGKKRTIAELEARAGEPDFWNDSDRAQGVLKEQARLKSTVDGFEAQLGVVEDARILIDLADEAKDEATAAEVAVRPRRRRGGRRQDGVRPHVVRSLRPAGGAALHQRRAPAGPSRRTGPRCCSGCTPAGPSAAATSSSSSTIQPGDEAGIKSVTLGIRGEWAYGYLRAEAGVHRLVRISPYDAQARRHTSFASVFVYPDIDETVKVEIDEKDLRVETMRSGGAGGQHVNKTESAIRITHVPSGIAVHCQSERSQHKNRATAMRILRSKLIELEQRKMEEKMGGIHAAKKAIEWGSQIRSYVLAPYRLVSDHRTEIKVGNVDARPRRRPRRFHGGHAAHAGRGSHRPQVPDRRPGPTEGRAVDSCGQL